VKKPSREEADHLLSKPFDLDAAKSRLERHWKNGRRPNFWTNDAAARASILLYRRANIKDAADIINERFGPSLTSKSAVSRFWKHVLSKAIAAGMVV
jgi:hypothetical protein